VHHSCEGVRCPFLIPDFTHRQEHIQLQNGMYARQDAFDGVR
jgi:hypothetical protein